MRKGRLEIAASVIWFVVAGLFAVVLIFHVKNHSFQYSHVSIEQRPGAIFRNPNYKPPGGPGSLSIGPNGVYIGGMDLDEPLRKFGNDFNDHIDELNKEKTSESWLLIVLDLVGMMTALLSGIYELLKRREAATAYRTAIVAAPPAATPPGAPTNRNDTRQASMIVPPAMSKPIASPDLSILWYIALAGLFSLGAFIMARWQAMSRHLR